MWDDFWEDENQYYRNAGDVEANFRQRCSRLGIPDAAVDDLLYQYDCDPDAIPPRVLQDFLDQWQ